MRTALLLALSLAVPAAIVAGLTQTWTDLRQRRPTATTFARKLPIMLVSLAGRLSSASRSYAP